MTTNHMIRLAVYHVIKPTAAHTRGSTGVKTADHTNEDKCRHAGQVRHVELVTSTDHLAEVTRWTGEGSLDLFYVTFNMKWRVTGYNITIATRTMSITTVFVTFLSLYFCLVAK